MTTTWLDAHGAARCPEGHVYQERAYRDGCPLCEAAEADRRPGEDGKLNRDRERIFRRRLGLNAELHREALRRQVLDLLADDEVRAALREALGPCDRT